MEIHELQKIYRDIVAAAETKKIARHADRFSNDITHHNYPHFLRSASRAKRAALAVEKCFPGTFRKEHIAFHVPMAGFGHDFDRSLGADPAVPGQLLDQILEARDVPRRDRDIVKYAVANHSAGPSRKALAYSENMSELDRDRRLITATTVLGDASDAIRVRCRAHWMRQMAALQASGNAPSYFEEKADNNMRNWMACYAIRKAQLVVDPSDNGNNPRYKGTLVLVWEMDEDMCHVAQILNIPWFARKQHGCENAAQNVLGLNYAIEANGTRYFFSKKAKTWWTSRKGLWLPQSA